MYHLLIEPLSRREEYKGVWRQMIDHMMNQFECSQLICFSVTRVSPCRPECSFLLTIEHLLHRIALLRVEYDPRFMTNSPHLQSYSIVVSEHHFSLISCEDYGTLEHVLEQLR